VVTNRSRVGTRASLSVEHPNSQGRPYRTEYLDAATAAVPVLNAALDRFMGGDRSALDAIM
jgi:hypothetical protein